MKLHPDGLPDDMGMHQLLWRTTMQVLPAATLNDHARVSHLLQLELHPLSADEQAKVDEVKASNRS
jgi:hypothetical protein